MFPAAEIAFGMPKNTKTIVISLGGSIICPQPDKIDTNFLREFRLLILAFLKRGFKFIIIPGGGKVCRLYQGAASEIAKVNDEDKDWIGIHTTRLNAHLLRTIFREQAYPVILEDPRKPVNRKWKLLIGAGWRPGCSSDMDSVLLAKRFKIKEIINAGNISFVFDKNPAEHKDAESFKDISWRDYRKIVGSKWTPGLSTPFDPIASKLAQALKIRVFIVKGTELKNLEKAIAGENFRGTVISG